MTHPYTPAQLEALLKDATPGPWRVEDETTLIWGHCNQDDNSTRGMGYPIAEAKLRTSGWNAYEIKWPTVTANAALIAAAPDLARLVLEKDAEIARLKAALKPFADAGPGHVRSGIWHHHDGHDALILTAEDFTEARQAREGNQ